MKEQSMPSDESSSLSQVRRVDEACLRFEAAWKAGRRPPIHVYMNAATASYRPALVRELIHLEIHYRRLANEDPRPQEYLSLFASLDTAWLEGVLSSRRAPGRSLPGPVDMAALAAATTIDVQQAAPSSVESPRKNPAGATAPARMILIPGYNVLGPLGRGAMGVVYKAYHLALKREVALKMIRDGALAGPNERTRFRTEAQAIARLKHPNIVQVYDVAEFAGHPYFSLEFCTGGSLDKKLNGTPLPPKEAARQVEVLARAMHAAHQQNIVHRDLKPANVLLAADGQPKITDFGLAKKLDEVGDTQSGAIMGTPSYMAPEQAAGKQKEVGPLADVYALGAILYECLTGRPPFKAATVMETLAQVLADEPVPPRQLQPKMPRDLQTICLKCLQKAPKNRYAHAEALAQDLRRFQAGEPITARPVGPVERSVKWVRRWPVVSILLTLFVVSLVVGTGVAWWLAALANDRADQIGHDRDAIKGLQKQTEATLLKSQERLADQLILSVGRDPKVVDPLEWKALWEIAGLPKSEERTRMLFIDRALNTSETAELLERRMDMAIHATVGLDQTRREEVLKILQLRLADREGDGGIRTLSALAVAELVPADQNEADMEAQAILDAMARSVNGDPTRDRRMLEPLGQALIVVAARMDASLAAQRIIDAIAKSSAPQMYTMRTPLVQMLGAVASRLDAAAAASVAREILDAMDKTTNPEALTALAQALVAATPQLDAAAAASVARGILNAMDKPSDPYMIARLAPPLIAVVSRLDAPAAAPVAQRILDAMDKTSDSDSLAAFTQPLAAAAPRLDAAPAAAVAQRIFNILDKNPNSVAAWGLAHALAAVGSRLDAAAATATAPRIFDIMDKNSSHSMFTDLARALAAVAPQLDAALAAASAQRILDAMDKTGDSGARTALAPALSALGSRLDAAGAASVTRSIIDAMEKTSNPFMAADLAPAFTAVAPRLDAAAAATSAQRILDAMDKTSNPFTLIALAPALGAVAPRLGPDAAASVARSIVDTMVKTPYPEAITALAHALGAVAPRLDAAAAATSAQRILDAIDKTANPGNGAFSALAPAFTAVAPRLDAAAAATSAQRILDAMDKTSNPFTLTALAPEFTAVAPRLDAAAAATSAQRILDAFDKTSNSGAFDALAPAFTAVVPRLDAAAAATSAQRILDAMDKTSNPFTLTALTQALGAVAPRLDPAAAAAALTQVTKGANNTSNSTALVQRVSALAPRLDAGQAAPAAAVLAQTMKDAKDANALAALALGLSALAARLEPKDAAAVAAPAVAILAQAMTDTNCPPNASAALTQGLSALASRLDARDAAPAAVIFAQALKDNRNPYRVAALALGLSALASRLHARDAAPAAAVLAQTMKDAKDANALAALARGLSALAARLEPEDAAAVTSQAATTIACRAVTTLSQGQIDTPGRASALSVLLTDIPSVEIRSRLATAAASIACPAGAGHPFAALSVAALEPPPCRLSTQQLVRLLKMPPCTGEVRRVVLDRLGDRYHRPFSDAWEFVRFATEQQLDLDFTSPPSLPEADTATPKP